MHPLESSVRSHTMSIAEINALTLIAAVVAATVAKFSPDGGWMVAVDGLLIALVLLAFDRDTYRSMSQSVALGGVTGYALTVGAIGLLAFGHSLSPQSVPSQGT